MGPKYDDDYATCESTYVTLRLYSETINAEEISIRLGVQPTSMLAKGETRNPSGRRPTVNKQHGWFLSSEKAVQSRDVRRHLDWLLDMMSSASDKLRTLEAEGVRADVSCFWMSQSGQGGPTLSSSQLARLAALGVDIWFDFYAPSGDV